MTAKGGSHASPPIPIALGGQDYGPAVKDVEREWREVQKTLSGVNHYGSWVEAALSGNPKKAGSNFDYAVPMTQAILLGCIALRFPGQELHWDNAQRRFSNLPEANEWLTVKPRKGYDLRV